MVSFSFWLGKSAGVSDTSGSSCCAEGVGIAEQPASDRDKIRLNNNSFLLISHLIYNLFPLKSYSQ